MASIAGKSDQYPVRTLNSRYGNTRVNCTERSGIVRRYEIHSQHKAGRSSRRICHHASHLFEGGGGGRRPALVWLTPVGYQGVEFYYFNSKILIIYFIILIVKFYFNSKFA